MSGRRTLRSSPQPDLAAEATTLLKLLYVVKGLFPRSG